MRLAVFLVAVTLHPMSGSAQDLAFNFEMRQLLPELGFIARDVYLCEECTLEQFEAIVPPPGWQKADARVQLFDSATVELPVPPPGVPESIDFVPDLAGEEFLYTARVLDGDLLPNGSAVAQVARSTVLTYDAGRVVHEVTDDEGRVFVLFTFNHALSESTYDLFELGSLADLEVPEGWSYGSRVLDAPLHVDSGGLATVFVQGPVATYQLVPEPAAPLLLAAGILACGIARRLRGPERASDLGKSRRNSSPSSVCRE